jgi:hypothetical protein
MGYSKISVDQTPHPVAGPDGLTIIAVGAPRGSYEARGPF